MRAAVRIALGAFAAVLFATGPALAGPATTNSDGDVLMFSVGVSPPVASTARTPRGVSLQLDAFAGNRINADAAIPTNSLTFVLPRGFAENGLRFPACTITPNAISPCSPASRIGSGTAEITLLNPGNETPTFTTARVSLYNGAPQTPGGPPTLAFVTRLAGRPAGELDFTVRPTALGLVVSQILVASSGPGIGLTKVSLTIPDRQTTVRVAHHTSVVHLLDAPQTCTGSWTFSLSTTSAGRKPIVAFDHEPCVGSSAQPARRRRSAAVSGL